MRAAIVALAALSACVHVDRAMLVASTASIVCDAGQTLRAAGNFGPLHGQQSENNPVMGSYPSRNRVEAYFVGVTVLNAAIWYALPRGLRSAYAVPVTGVQTVTIYNNKTREGLGLCGIGEKDKQ